MNRRVCSCGVFEALESRLCPTTFQYETLSQYLNINPLIAELSPPPLSESVGFGASVAGIGDIDGDGVPDLAVGADGIAPDGGLSAAGVVYLFSGKTRAVIGSLSDGSIGFGSALVNLGDVNGDGVPDLAVGSPDRATGTTVYGAVVVYSGKDSSVLWEVVGDAPVGQLGRSLATIMDVDADGVADLAAGGRVGTRGEVRVLSGKTGTLITTLSEGDSNESFGEAVSAMPGNRVHNAILAVGAPQDGNGKVYTYAQDWSSAFVYSGQWTGGAFGTAVTMFGGQLAVGAPDAVLSQGTGVVVMFDLGGPFGYPDAPNLAMPSSVSDHFGRSLADVGDLNGDGVPDLAVGQANSSGGGSVRIISFIPNSHGFYIAQDIASGPTSALLGGALANVGDLDGDGTPDLLTGTARPGQTTPAATIVSLLPTVWGAPSSLAGTSRDLRWMWPSPIGGYNEQSRLPYLIHDNRVAMLAAVPGLLASDTEVMGISDDGSIAVVVDRRGAAPVYTYIRGGQRLTITQAITSMVGGNIDPALLVPVLVGPGGHILLDAGNPIQEASSAWVLDPDGTLRFLWNGVGADVNSSGTVVGTRFLAGGGNQAVVYSGGVVTTVPGMAGAQAVNSQGDIAGWNDTDEVVIVKGGVRSVAGHVNALAGENASTFKIVRLDDADRLLGTANYPIQGGHTLYWSAAAGLVLADLLVVGAPASVGAGVVGMDSVGVIIGPEFALKPVDDRVGYVARDPGTGTVVTGSGGVQVVATDVFGEPVVFTRDAGGVWHGKDARTGFHVATSQQDFVAWIDPVDGLTYVVFVTDHDRSPLATAMLRDATGQLGAPSIWTINAGSIFNAITGGLALFTGIDGTVYITGRDDSGDLLLLTRNHVQMSSADAWTVANLTHDHLAFQGLATPVWTDTPVTYVTPWNGLNIAGVDSAGHVQVVWWAPGMTLWRADDLSMIAAAPALTGGITAFTTPWGGINVVGATATGDLTALWWAPALGGTWLTSSLSDAAGSAIKFLPGTLTSYVTPWGGLNVAGVDENHGVTIFWWALDANRWTASTVTPDSSIVPVPVGPLSSGVTASGAVHINGVGTGGHVVDLSWAPAGMWTLEDITETAV